MNRGDERFEPEDFLLAVPIPNGGPLTERERVNPLRALFGDRLFRFIYLDPGQQTPAQIERLEQLFPEAKLLARPPEPVRPVVGDGTAKAFGD